VGVQEKLMHLARGFLSMCENSLRSLIDSVASSNLETFHSKAIAWTLNSLESVDENAAFFCWLFEKAFIKK
jgi:hypothetical protein